MRASILQILPEFKGKKRLGALLHGPLIGKKRPLQIKTAGGLQFEVPNLVENVSFDLFINGYYEKQLVEYLVANLPRNGIFYDVGANIGAISVFVAALRKDVRVYAFEASPRVFGFLTKNIQLNKLTNIHAINAAVDVEDDKVRDFYSPEDKYGKGSFKPVFTDKAETVNTVRLDTFIKRNPSPDFVKVDVEGFERLIFASLEETLLSGKKKPAVIFEFVDWAEEAACGEIGSAQRYVRSLGYTVYDFDEYRKGRIRELPVINKGSRNLLAIAIQ